MTPSQKHTLWVVLIRIVPLALLIVVMLMAWRNARHLDLREIQRTLAAIAPWQLVALAASGLLAVAAIALYDIIAARALALHRPFIRSLRTGIVASGISNVAGLSGITGSGLRVLLLIRDGFETTIAVRYAALVTLSLPLGLAILCIVVLAGQSSLPDATGLPEWMVWSALGAFACYLPGYALIAGTPWFRLGRLAAVPHLRPGYIAAFIAASLFEWLLAGLLLWACLAAAGLSISPLVVLGAFVLAAALGTASLLPGGIGVFDVMAATLLVARGAAPNAVVAALVVYRCCYFLVPLMVALLLGLDMLRTRWLSSTVPAHPLIRMLQWPLARIANLGISLLAILTALAGFVLLSGAAFPNLRDRSALLHNWLPLGAIEASHLASVAVGLTLIVAARGLALRLQRALWLALALLVAGAVTGLARGLDWVTSLLLGAIAILLFVSRDLFLLKGNLGRQLGAWQWTLALVMALGLYILLGQALYKPETLHPFQFDLSAHGARYIRGAMVATVSMIALLLWTWPRWSRVAFPLPTAVDLDTLHGWLDAHGSNGYSHLLMMGDKSLFYCADGNALIGFAPIHSRLIALGDPAGKITAREQAIAAFRHYAEQAHCTPVFYHVAPENLSLYLDNGFALFKLGELGRVDLRDFSMQGKTNQNKRGAINHAGRLGLGFAFAQPPFTPALIDEMRDVSDEWLGEHGTEKSFSLGRFDIAYLQRAPIALIRDANGRLQAFASILASYGQREEYSIDLMRHRRDAPSGTMDFLFVSLMQAAAAQGYQWFSMGMAPLAGVGDTPWANNAEQLAHLAFEYGNIFFNYKGLHAFKDKWHPQWRSTYLAYPPQASLTSIQLDILALVSGGYRHILGGAG